MSNSLDYDDRTDSGTFVAECALIRIYISGFFQDLDLEITHISGDLLNFAVNHELDLVCLETSTIFGVRMHWEQSRVGKVSESWIIWPPMEGDRSTRMTSKPGVARSKGGLDTGDAAADHQGSTGDRNADGLQGFILVDRLHRAVGDLPALCRGLVLVFVDPAALFADVGDLTLKFVDPGCFGGIAEGGFVESGGTAGHHDVVQFLFFDGINRSVF